MTQIDGDEPDAAGKPRRAPTDRVIKSLAMRCGGVCSYLNCTQALVMSKDEIDDGTVIGEMAHICGEKPNSNRFNPDLSVDERRALANLMFMCPNHHERIDKKENEQSYPVELLRKWKADHEARVDAAIRAAFNRVTFAELEEVAKAIVMGNVAASSHDFTVTDPEAKMARNEMTDASRPLLQMGLGAAAEVAGYLKSAARLDADFPERLSAAFKAEYLALWSEGVRGDDLFHALHAFASRRLSSPVLQAAGLAVLAYLFEACEVFEK
ncbi:hypothetical protein [uncultured Brevundimonas sp.]|uniref:hypothetical protein n=1 Tax=uncultured Brevundimonas sp. TaxID=213418 RepID=UPI0025E4E106|nr:hypothetical protein [uncultured Brevundimonas sp.]